MSSTQETKKNPTQEINKDKIQDLKKVLNDIFEKDDKDKVLYDDFINYINNLQTDSVDISGNVDKVEQFINTIKSLTNIISKIEDGKITDSDSIKIKKQLNTIKSFNNEEIKNIHENLEVIYKKSKETCNKQNYISKEYLLYTLNNLYLSVLVAIIYLDKTKEKYSGNQSIINNLVPKYINYIQKLYVNLKRKKDDDLDLFIKFTILYSYSFILQLFKIYSNESNIVTILYSEFPTIRQLLSKDISMEIRYKYNDTFKDIYGKLNNEQKIQLLKSSNQILDLVKMNTSIFDKNNFNEFKTLTNILENTCYNLFSKKKCKLDKIPDNIEYIQPQINDIFEKMINSKSQITDVTVSTRPPPPPGAVIQPPSRSLSRSSEVSRTRQRPQTEESSSSTPRSGRSVSRMRGRESFRGGLRKKKYTRRIKLNQNKNRKQKNRYTRKY